MSDEKKIYDAGRVLTDVYGPTPPKAAEFGKGATDLSQIKDACDKQHNQKPGEYHRR